MSKLLTKQIPILITSWAGAVTLEYLLVPHEYSSLTGLMAIVQMSGLRVTLVTGLLVALGNLLVNSARRRYAQRWLLLCVFALYGSYAIVQSFTWAFLGVCMLITLLLSVYAGYGRNSSPLPSPSREKTPIFAILTGLAALAFWCIVSVWTVARVRSFSCPTYDFGIFSQMFYNMKETGHPITTLERDGVLSHFAVHVSPVYYWMLPFYALVPRPETLQVLQAAILASSVIPLWKIGKQYGLSPALRMMVCFLLLLYPAYAGGTSYDLHENCFLTPLMLWLLYGIGEMSTHLTLTSALLTLMVKEDAAVYVAVIALYLMLKSGLRPDKWGIVTGCILLTGSVCWFVGVTGYLSTQGDGVMTYRYQNFIYDGSSSLVTVIKAAMLCPMKVIYECVDQEKLKFIALTILPILGLPLATRRYERFILLIPYLLVNLMSDYRYQHDIFFQYTFGSTALLIYLVTINVADWKEYWKRAAVLGVALSISLGSFLGLILPKAIQYTRYCMEYGSYYDAQRAALNQIPEDASVAATTFYTVYLSNREQLYDIRYGAQEHILECDYIALKVNDEGSFKKYEENGENGKENFVALLLEHGYILEYELDGTVEIYRKIQGYTNSCT